MRVAIDGQMLGALSSTGMTRCFAGLTRGLIGLGEEAKIFLPYRYDSPHLDELPPGTVVGQRRTGRVPSGAASLRALTLTNHFRARGSIRDWKPDIVHPTYWWFLGGDDAPRVLTVQSISHEHEVDRRGWWVRRAKLRALKRADHVICVSARLKRDVLEIFGLPDNKVSAVLHGYDDLSIRGRRDGRDFGGERPYLLYVGTRGSHKNFWPFLEAVAASKPISADLDVVAFGTVPFSPEEKRRISSLGYQHNSVRHVSGNDDLLADCYKNAVAFVFPSLVESFGFPSLEAMSCGCPVIASNASAMPEVIGDAAEFFDPYQVDDIRRAIEAVVYSDTRKEELRKLGYERLKLFSWEKCARETLEVYRSVVGNTGLKS